MHFSVTFLGVLVILSLIGIVISVVMLVYLFIKDMKSKTIW
jgi:hypothetical protein